MNTKTHDVILSLGHCGGGPNNYTVFSGTEDECIKHIKALPRQQQRDTCQHCGGFTGTHAVQEQVFVEPVEVMA